MGDLQGQQGRHEGGDRTGGAAECLAGIRVNCIQPGLMNTPMAVDARMDAWNMSRDEVVAMRDAKVPLGNKMGTAWDVANAALFLVSDQARFITGVTLMVDGGAHCRIG